ncbi:MAG: DUF3267 domain-containing protein [Planctomycetota bacterium]|jgi:hypothetical protein
MKLRLGRIPPSPDFQPEMGGWHPLREPGPMLMQALAIPIAVAVLLALGGAATWLGMPRFWEAHPLLLAVIVVGVIPVHELIHVAAHPGGGRSPYTYVGFWPATLLFYAHYDHVLTRNRMLLILLLPFLVLSVFPLVLCGLTGWRWNGAALLSVWNGVLASGDLFGSLIVTWQVPREAWVRNQGYRTWWTADESVAAAEEAGPPKDGGATPEDS